MKRALALLLTVVMLAGMLAACGQGGADDSSQADATESNAGNADTESGSEEAEQPDLSGEIIVAINRTDLETEITAYAQEFMDEHPGTVITFEFIKDYDDVVATRIAGGEAPDLFYVVNPITSDTYSEYFLPIDDLPVTADDILYYEQGRGADGNLYTLPLTVSYCGIIYNKASFAQAGITQVPTTIEEFYEVCDKLQEAGITAVGTAFKDVWPMYTWCGWGEVNLTAGDERGQSKYVDQDEIYDELMLESMGIVRELYKKGQLEEDIMSANWDQFKLDFAQGKVAMHYSETWLPSQFVELGANQEDIGMFPFPGAANIKSGNGKMWGVSKDTEYPELAKEFFTYMLENPYADDLIPSNVHIEVEDPFVAELLSYGVEAISALPSDATFTNIKNEIELDGQSFFLSYVMEEDDEKAQAMVDEWNAKWAEARKDYVE